MDGVPLFGADVEAAAPVAVDVEAAEGAVDEGAVAVFHAGDGEAAAQVKEVGVDEKLWEGLAGFAEAFVHGGEGFTLGKAGNEFDAGGAGEPDDVDGFLFGVVHGRLLLEVFAANEKTSFSFFSRKTGILQLFFQPLSILLQFLNFFKGKARVICHLLNRHTIR